jgi:hypothetical protein
VTWTAKELREAIALRRAGWSYRRIGRLLGCAYATVWTALARHAPDLVTPRPTFEALAPKLRGLHGKGYTDTDAARQLGVCRNTAALWRRKLGLGDNRGSDRQRAKWRAHFRRVAHRAGKPHTRAIQAEVLRARCARAGWPDAESPEEMEVLELLCDRGPLTLYQVAEARGCHWQSAARLLARLCRRGLAAKRDRARRGVAGGRGGRMPSLYALAEGVGRHVSTRERSEGRVPRAGKRVTGEEGG